MIENEFLVTKLVYQEAAEYVSADNCKEYKVFQMNKKSVSQLYFKKVNIAQKDISPEKLNSNKNS